MLPFSRGLQMALSITATAVLIATVLPVMLIALCPVVAIYLFLQSFFRSSSRELKRLESTTQSPVFSYFRETLGALESVRGYNVVEDVIAEAEHRAECNIAPFWVLNLVNRWLGVRLELLGTSLVGAIGLVVAATAGSAAPGTAGLVLSYSLAVIGDLNWLIRELTDTEAHMCSVERIDQYCGGGDGDDGGDGGGFSGGGMPREAAATLSGDPDPSQWPTAGKVEIRNLTVRYRPHLPPALRGVTLTIDPGAKVGVVGRTGSGKSTLVLALLRIIEPSTVDPDNGGSVAIDGVDTGTLGLRTLRRAVAVITQDPTLFGAGTLRYNLDPLGVHSDEQLWAALEQAQIARRIEREGGLGSLVADAGDNFSVGERQLIAMARAMLNRARVVIMDEASASVDNETDTRVQAMIRQVFRDATVITIAHRLGTIADSDKVLVMDDGQVAEFDEPRQLMKNTNSLFAKLVKQADPTEVERLVAKMN
jgi:ATP-binding cassette subfamily C (CFTR/MRP) protein 1